MTVESRSSVGMVTISEHKALAVRNALPHHAVLWIAPVGPDETTFSAVIPHTPDRSYRISNAKADYWETEEVIPLTLYNDVTRIVQNSVFDRPKDPAELLDQIMRQSGQEVLLRASFTAKGDRRTNTIVVDSILRTLPFTLKQAKEQIERDAELARNVSGGLPVEWSHLFDRTKPIQREYKNHGTGRIIGLPDMPWGYVKDKTHKALITGAYPQPLQHLVGSMLPS